MCISVIMVDLYSSLADMSLPFMQYSRNDYDDDDDRNDNTLPITYNRVFTQHFNVHKLDVAISALRSVILHAAAHKPCQYHLLR